MRLRVRLTLEVPDEVDAPEETVANDIRDMLNGDLDSGTFDVYRIHVESAEVLVI